MGISKRIPRARRFIRPANARGKKPQQVVGDADGDGLDALADLIGGPRLVLVELVFVLVERLPDVPAQAPDLVDSPGGRVIPLVNCSAWGLVSDPAITAPPRSDLQEES